MNRTLKTLGFLAGGLVIAVLLIYLCYPGLVIQAARHGLRWRAGLDRYEIKVQDHKWVYLKGGQGKETVIFVHGLGADKDHWTPFLPAFSDSYELIVPDIPGFGESSRLPSASYDVPTQAQRLDLFIKALDLESFHLVGVSLGGYISAYYAAQRQGEILSLILMDAAGVLPEKHTKAWRDFMRKGDNPFLYRTPEGVNRLVELIFHSPPWIPGRFKSYYAEKGAKELQFRKKIIEDMEDRGLYLLEGRLEKINVNTLIIWGEKDEVIHVSAADRFARGIKRSKKVVLENCGHVPYIEKPGKTGRCCLKFLESSSEKE